MRKQTLNQISREKYSTEYDDLDEIRKNNIKYIYQKRKNYIDELQQTLQR